MPTAQAVGVLAEIASCYMRYGRIRMNIGIIGFGNLGRALASGLLTSGCARTDNIYVCESSPEARALAANEPYRVHATDDVNSVICDSDVIFFVVKSYVFEEMAANIDRQSLTGKTIVSFMAGVSFDKIFSLIGEVRLVRAMPSLAISVCDGVIGYTKAPPEVESIFHKLGYAFETDQEGIGKVTAFSGCGLGFAAYLIDAYALAGQTMGFSPETSAHIAALTFRNAVSRGDFKNTVKSVATPGGATEQGVLHMDECKVYDIVAGAVRKAYDRMGGV